METTSSPLRRLLLETFQYLELREIEQVVAFVCKQWFHITRDNELWKARYLTLPNPSDRKEDNYLASVQFASCLSVLTALWSLSMPISGKDSNSLAARLDFGHFTSGKVVYMIWRTR